MPMLIMQVRNQFAQYVNRILNHAAVFARMDILTWTINLQLETRASPQGITYRGRLRIRHAARVGVQGKVGSQLFAMNNQEIFQMLRANLLFTFNQEFYIDRQVF